MTSNRRVTPHAGVWIETLAAIIEASENDVTPHAGVWIETAPIVEIEADTVSLPTRECGLKRGV